MRFPLLKKTRRGGGGFGFGLAEGTIGLGRRVRVSYLDQERTALEGDLSVYECVARAVPSVDKERVDHRTATSRSAR